MTAFIESVVPPDMHLKRVDSLTRATTGLLHAARLGIRAIGRGVALAYGTDAKHGVKQVDRLLSNEALDVWSLFASWVPFVVAQRTEIWVALDWTEFDADGHSTLAANLVTKHGRSTPLIWKSLTKEELTGQRLEWEETILRRLSETLPATVTRVVVMADRGFGDAARWDAITALGFDYLIRFRGDYRVTDERGEERAAVDWVSNSGQARTLKNARITLEQKVIPTFVAVREEGMKDAWCLASSVTDMTGSALKKAYGRRFTIEESFRDLKDLRFGMGLKTVRVSRTSRRDRLLLLSAFAVALLTLLGAAGEAAGIDRYFKTNTSKKRQYSLFHQGCDYFEFLPGMRDERAELLLREFDALLVQHPLFKDVLGVI